jgi:transcriptional regulator with XRE-family HTH domain
MPVKLKARTLNRSVAEEIRVEMTRRRVSQVALAELLGHNQNWVSERLTCKIPLKLDEVEEIARVLGVRVDHLFVFEELAPRRRRVS